MRLFIFLPQLPYPPRSGGRIVTAPLVEGLAKKHEVHLFALTHGFEGERDGRKAIAEKVASVTTVPGTGRIDPRPLASAVFSRDLYKVHRFCNRRLMRKAAELATRHPPDAVHCQNFYTARYGKEILAHRKVLYKENFETLLLERWAETASKPLLPALINIEKRRTLRFEMESCLWFDEVVTISNRDEKNLREAARAFPDTEKHLKDHLRTVLPSIQLDYYDAASLGDIPDPFPQDGRKRLLVTGSFNYLANVDGALWLTGEVLPKLSGGEYSLWLVGQHPAPAVQNLHNPPHIHVTGSVPDVRPYFLHADLALVPLRIGGGIRLKILESLAMGCPLVSTSVGCEGLWSEEDPPVWRIADSPEDFADAIDDSCRVPPNSEGLRAWVEKRFSPERFVAEMESLYEGK
jgi:glycosyltransferase involved in cell wall biosynthesis